MRHPYDIGSEITTLGVRPYITQRTLLSVDFAGCVSGNLHKCSTGAVKL